VHHETKQTLNNLLAKTGHALVVDDISDIIELDALAGQVADPQDGIDSPLLNHAVYFRSVPVYPLTLAHLTFLDESSAVLGIGDDERVLCMLWVATIQEITDSLYDQEASRKAYRKWARRSPWTPSDIEAILELRYGKLSRQADGNSNAKDNTGALIAMLAREYGDSPGFWMYRAALGVVESCIADWTARQESQAAAYRKANKGGGGAPVPSPKFVSARKFRECAERIEEKWLARKA